MPWTVGSFGFAAFTLQSEAALGPCGELFHHPAPMEGLKYISFSCLTFSLFGLLVASKLTPSQIEYVLNRHNDIRNRAAMGTIPGHPAGGDLVLMEWDADMEHTAEMEMKNILSGGEHDPELLGDDNIGHSQARNMNIEESVDSWWSGLYSHLHGSGCIPGDAKCLAFAQMVQSDVSKVGCAISTRPDGSPRLFICHYKPKVRRNGAEPYKAGSPKEICPDDFAFQSINMPGLCASKEICEESVTTTCICHLDQCQNDGVFNVDQCNCHCPISFGGLGCQSCEINSCDNGGLFNSSTCACLCADGYQGNRCEIVVMDIKEEDLILSSGGGSGFDLDTETFEEFDSTCFTNTQGAIFSETFSSSSPNLEYDVTPSAAPSNFKSGSGDRFDATIDDGMVTLDMTKSKCSQDANFASVNWKSYKQPQTVTARTIEPVQIVRGTPTCVRFYYSIFGDDPGTLLIRFEMYRNVEDLTVVEDDQSYELTGRSFTKPAWVSQEIDLKQEMDFMFIEFIGKHGTSGVAAFDSLLVFPGRCRDVPK